MQLGNHPFVGWLETNGEQFRNRVDVVVPLDWEQNSEVAEQFHAVEQLSDHWLRRFHGDESDLEKFEEPVLPGDVDGDETVGFDNSLTLSANFAKDVELGR